MIGDAVVRGLDEGIKKLGPLVTLELCALDIEVKEKQYDDALKRLDTADKLNGRDLTTVVSPRVRGCSARVVTPSPPTCVYAVSTFKAAA